MTAASQSEDRMIGQVLGDRYEVLERLGEGAMGVVYKARHIKVGRTFAVKLLHPHLLDDPKTEVRFDREAELAGRLRHANVVGVVDVGDIDGMRYMVMELAEGPDLAELLVEAPMHPTRIIHLVRQILEGLYHAHEQGLIHRDLKPENVIVERDTHGAEMPRIVDFGIAILRDGGGVDGLGRLTTDGLVLGTPHYMAPEQAVADPIDHRIDLFALGIVIYEMLSGYLPFDGSGAEIARANLLLDPPRIADRVKYLEVDPLLEAFARRLMAKKPAARPPTAKAARELLDLIERDRRAAAAALGLPSVASLRVPAATQPVARHERPAPLVWPAAPPTTRLRAPSSSDPAPPGLPPPPAAMPSASTGLPARAASPIVLSVIPNDAAAPGLLAPPIPPTMTLVLPAATAGLPTPTSVLPTVASIPPTPASVQRTVEMLAIPAMPGEPPIVRIAAAPAVLEGPRVPLIKRDLNTAVRSPLDWPPAPPPTTRPARRTGIPWFATAAGLGAVSIVAALIATRTRSAPQHAAAPTVAAQGARAGSGTSAPDVVHAPPASIVPVADPAAAPSRAVPDPPAEPPPHVAALASAETAEAATSTRKPSRRHRATSATTNTVRSAQETTAPPVERTALHPADGRGTSPARSAAESQRGSIDGRGTSPAGSAAESQRGSIDGRGTSPARSAAEWQRGSIDGRGRSPAGSAAEWQRGSIDPGISEAGGITPSAVSKLYSATARALDALPAENVRDLRELFRHYNVQALMLAPQTDRDDAAAQLSRLLREAKRRKAL